MTNITKIGGRSGQFPVTQWSAILAARSKDPHQRSRGLEAVAAAYWKPIYMYFRLRWGKSNEDAKDLTQGFFTRVIEKEFLDSFDPAKASLRTFLRGSGCRECHATRREDRDAEDTYSWGRLPGVLLGHRRERFWHDASGHKRQVEAV